PIRNPVVESVWIERPFAELKLVQMLIPAIIRLEGGVMELRESLVAADFNRAANHLVGELLAGGPTGQEERKHVQLCRRRLCRSRRLAHGRLSRSGTSRRLALVPGRELVFRNQYLQRPWLPRVAQDQPFPL